MKKMKKYSILMAFFMLLMPLIVKASTVQNLASEGDTITWDAFEGASKYQVYVKFGTDDAAVASTTTELTASFSTLKAAYCGEEGRQCGTNDVGTYYVYVIPVDGDDNALGEKTDDLTFVVEQKYDVTFYSKGGSSVDPQQVVEGQTADKPNDPTLEGYRFMGWCTVDPDTNSSCDNYDFSTAVSANLDLYAKWAQLYTLTIVTDPTDPTDNKVEFNGIKRDNGFTIPAIAGEQIFLYAKATDDYVFDVAVSDEATVANNGSIGRIITMPASNATVTFKFKQLFEVSFDTHGGSEVASQKIKDGAYAAVPDSPTRDGYRFAGWYTTSDCDVAFDFANTTITQATTIHAKWIKTYTVEFNTNGGNNINSQIVDENTKAAKPANPTKNNNLFLGWYSNSNFTEEFNFDNNITANTVVYAKWLEVKDNYSKFATSKMNKLYIVEVGNDIKSIVNNACNDAKNLTGGKYNLVYISDGNYTTNEVKLDSCSNVYIVLEKNAIVKSASTNKYSIFKVTGNSNNVTIYGGTLDSDKKGSNTIEITDSNNTVNIDSILVKNSPSGGIRVYNSKNVTISNVTLTSNTQFGINIDKSSVTLNNSNTSSNGDKGIRIVNNSNVTIKNVNSESNSDDGIYINKSNVNISDFKSQKNKTNGANVENSTVVISNSTLNNNTDKGIRIITNSNATLNSVSASNNNGGIRLIDSKLVADKITVLNNNDDGIYVKNSNFNISNSEIGKNKTNGININDATAEVKNIKSYENGAAGVRVYNSTTKINDSSLYNNKEHGVSVSNGANLTIRNSKIYNNNWCGISSNGTNTKSYIYYNEIYGNGVNAKATDEGELGHGVGVFEGAYSDIQNNNINNNKVCGVSGFGNIKIDVLSNKINNNGRHGIGLRKDVTINAIRNNEISSNGYNGILASDNTKGSIESNTITKSGQYGVSSVSSVISLTKNRITYNKKTNLGVADKSTVTLGNENYIENSSKEHGITVTEKSTLNVNGTNNKIQYNKKNGISLTGDSTLNMLVKNTVYKNGQNGISVVDSTANIKSVKIRANSKNGVYVSKSKSKSKLTISKSTVSENTKDGIYVYGKSNTASITSNTVENNKGCGIVITNKASASDISSNKVNKNKSKGIMVRESSTVNKINKNNINSNKDYSIAIYNSKVSKEIFKNTIKSNKNGIMINKSTVKNIKNNTIEKNGEVGIFVKASSTVKNITSNTIKKYSKYGIAIYSSKVDKTDGNTIKKSGKKDIYIG